MPGTDMASIARASCEFIAFISAFLSHSDWPGGRYRLNLFEKRTQYSDRRGRWAFDHSVSDEARRASSSVPPRHPFGVRTQPPFWRRYAQPTKALAPAALIC